MYPPADSQALDTPYSLESFARDLRYLWASAQIHPLEAIPELHRVYWKRQYPASTYGSLNTLRIVAAYEYLLRHQHELPVQPITYQAGAISSALTDGLMAAQHHHFSERPPGEIFTDFDPATVRAEVLDSKAV